MLLLFLSFDENAIKYLKLELQDIKKFQKFSESQVFSNLFPIFLTRNFSLVVFIFVVLPSIFLLKQLKLVEFLPDYLDQ